MKPELKYIEFKSGFGDNGPAWIGMAEFSKSGRTEYFNGKVLKNSNAQGIARNQFDIENGDEYQVSGIKKNGTYRHWAGGGKKKKKKNIVELYLSLVDFNVLDKNRFELTEIKTTDKQRFAELENKKLN